MIRLNNLLVLFSQRISEDADGTRKTKLILHGVPLYITEDHFGYFFARFGEVDDVSSIKSKIGIATRDVKIMVIMNRNFLWEFPMC